MKKILSLFLLPAVCFATELQLEKLPQENNVFTAVVQTAPVRYSWGAKDLLNKEEMITVLFKARVQAKPGEFCRIQAGIRQFAANGRRIYSINVNPVPGSDTVLLSPAYKGKKELHIKNKAWILQKGRTFVAVFGTKPDHSDLPNFSVSTNRNQVVKLTPKEDGSCIAELRQPLNRNWNAGTPLRLHVWSDKKESEYEFACWPGSSWKNYSFSKKADSWYPGARYIQLIFTVAKRPQFKDVKVQIEKPLLRKIASGGDLF